MLRTTSVLKPGDILINDRGFVSRNLINYLKVKKQVDTYVPLKANMESYKIAVQIAKEENKWTTHPSTRYPSQKICFVTDLGAYWNSDNPEEIPNVSINACVVWDKEDDKYFVFATTDISKTAIDILKIYNLRPEIEEDYRQLKDFWKLEDFKSTKLSVITFHIISVLFGYLFFQLFTMMPDGDKYAGKSLPIIVKNYIVKVQGFIVLYVGYEFGVLTLLELMELYANCAGEVKKEISAVIKSL